MSIRDKPLKKCHSDARITLDGIHNDLLQKYKNDLDILKKQIIDENNSNNVNNIQKKIDEVQNNINTYYLDNGLLLNDYYNNNYSRTKGKSTSKGILDFFTETDNKLEDTGDTDIVYKEDILSRYISNINDEYLNKNFEDIEDNIHICINCNNNMLYKSKESEIYCDTCGYTDIILINNEKSFNKEIPREISYFSYKRINHFNEWLAQFQAKETTDIPNEIYQKVSDELKKNINLDIKNITNKLVRDILKKLKLSKYYEHIPNISNIITGRTAPILTLHSEEILRSMFKDIQNPFMKHCPVYRKNFLSYSYVLHKFCQLLELDEFLIYFPLLKSREKLQQQDKIWNNICLELDWQYIPSI